MGMVVTLQLRRQKAQEGMTYARAMEAFERYFSRLEATPTVAERMGIPFNTICRALDGKIWPAARSYWMGRMFQ